jgi:hypothetical protein
MTRFAKLVEKITKRESHFEFQGCARESLSKKVVH